VCNLYTYKMSREEMRCIVPATMFTEPDRNTAKPVVNRWFGRADGTPFFFAGIWREWQGDVGTIPVMLMTAEDVDVWLNGTLEEALKLQRPRADEEIVITPYDEKKAA